jgi:hypothetical protein
MAIPRDCGSIGFVGGCFRRIDNRVSHSIPALGYRAKGYFSRLMGQDGVYLQVIATSGEGKEQRHAQRVYRLLQKGKHWVLVTLLLSNVIVNETLPIVLDRSLGGGWPAVLGSTVLIGMALHYRTT